MGNTAPAAKPAAKAAKGAPVAKSAPAKKQAPQEKAGAPQGKKASNLENPLRMAPIDTGLKNKYR